MAITISPLYPVPGDVVTITESTAIGDVQVVELTSAPTASAMELGFLLTDTDQVPTGAVSVAEGGWQSALATFDVPGEYGVSVYDIRQWPGAPGFPGDSGVYYQLISEYTGTIHVAGYTYLPMLAEGGSGATLRLTISNETVRAASLIDATTEAARQAALQSTVTAALAALVGDTVAAMASDLQTGVSDLRARYEAHRVLAGGVHFRADAINTIKRGDADSQPGAISLLNELRRQIVKHLQDSSSNGVIIRWHNANEDDLKNLPVSGAATDLATATVLSADLRERCYERHRVQIANPAPHTNPDNVNALVAPTDLDDLVVAYFDALVIVNPAVVAGEPEGIVDAEHRYGFKQE